MRPLPDRLLDDLRPRPMAVFDRILVPTDGSPSSRDAIDLAVRLAAAFSAALRIVAVIDREKLAGDLTMWNGGAAGDAIAAVARVTALAEALLHEAQAKAGDVGVAAETCVLTGDVVDELLLEVASWRADVIVIGTHARAQALTPALGSKTGELLRKATVPVLVVR